MSNVPSRAKRLAGTVGAVTAITAIGVSAAAGTAQATQYATGWQCLSPFANYTNNTYPDDPPAPNTILDSMDVAVKRTSGDPLVATPGKPLKLDDLLVTFDLKDPRVAEALYVRTSTLTTTYSGSVPLGATDAENRSLTLRTVPADVPVAGPASETHSFGGSPADITLDKPVAGERWWGFAVNNVDPDSAPINSWYTDGVPNASGMVTRTYYVDERSGNQVPRDIAGRAFVEGRAAVGHKYVTHTGDNRFAASAAVTLEATNTVEGVQTIQTEGSWIVNVEDSTPGSINDPFGFSDGGHTVTIPTVKFHIPTVRWTPTGAGPVEIRLAQPGQASGVVSRSTGYDRPGYNRPLVIKPYGPVWGRFETESYGPSTDCIPGSISIADPTILANPNSAASFFGNVASTNTAETPDRTVGSPENPGFYKNGQGSWVPAVGSRGRFAFAMLPQAPLAVAPLEAPAPAPTPVPTPTPAPTPAPAQNAGEGKGKTLSVPSSALKLSKSSKIAVRLSNPNGVEAGAKVTIRTASKVKLTRNAKAKTVTLVKRTSKYALKPGASRTVNVRLTSAGKRLLKTKKSIRVKVTIASTNGNAKAVTKTLTLKR